MAGITLNIENLTNNKTEFKADKKIIRQILKYYLKDKFIYEKSCLNGILYKKLSLDFVFCDDNFIHKINKEYRGYDRSTDVISFALFCDDPNSVNLEDINLGEIIVSVDTAKKQALKAKHSLKKEIYYLISHGILHLLGFDHQTQQEYNFMVDVQNKVIGKLNYD